MKAVILLTALSLAAPQFAANEDPQPAPPAAPRVNAPEFASPVAHPDRCADTIEQVRADRGRPLLDRRPADADAPILFKALDHQVAGCDVLLVADGDVRPIPAPQPGPVVPQRAQ